jgi:hypothetical protein
MAFARAIFPKLNNEIGYFKLMINNEKALYSFRNMNYK